MLPQKSGRTRLHELHRQIENDVITQAGKRFRDLIIDATITMHVELARQFPLVYDRAIAEKRIFRDVSKFKWEEMEYLDKPAVFPMLVSESSESDGIDVVVWIEAPMVM